MIARVIEAVRDVDPEFARYLSHVGGALRLIEIAEEEIEAAVRQWPLEQTRLSAAFSWLQPLSAVRAERLYRAHCAELLRRVVDAQAMAPATTAELIAVLSEMSLRAPLNGDHGFMYWRAMARVMPDVTAEIERQLGDRNPFGTRGEYDVARIDSEEGAIRRRIERVTPRFELARADRKRKVVDDGTAADREPRQARLL